MTEVQTLPTVFNFHAGESRCSETTPNLAIFPLSQDFNELAFSPKNYSHVWTSASSLNDKISTDFFLVLTKRKEIVLHQSSCLYFGNRPMQFIRKACRQTTVGAGVNIQEHPWKQGSYGIYKMNLPTAPAEDHQIIKAPL